MKSLTRILLLLLMSNFLFAQDDGYVGDWYGEIELPNNAELGVIFHITGSAKKLDCKMEVPAQGATDLAADKIYVASNTLYVEYPMLKAKYEGQLNNGEITGIWTQLEQSFPLNLKPATEAVKPKKSQEPEPPFKYDIAEIQLAMATKKGQHELAGTVTMPKGEGPFPMAVLVTGSGPQDRDETILGHKPFWVIADYLTNNGIAVLRYDDRGVGKSTGDFQSATTEDFLNDALFMVKSMKAYPKVDPEKIGIIGHSEGGLIAAMAAAKSAEVKFTVLLAGPGVNGLQILKKQINAIQEGEGVDKELLKKEAQVMSEVIDIAASDAKKEKRIANAKVKLKQFFDNSLSEEERKVYADNFETYFQTKTAGFFSPWMQYYLNIEPKTYLEKISCPSLALIGSVDLQVAPMDNIPALEAALKVAPTEDYVVKEIPNVNHLFQHSKTGRTSEYGVLEETFANEVLVMMRDWIKQL